MFCYNCGKELLQGAEFCGSCGAKIVSVEDEKSCVEIQNTPIAKKSKITIIALIVMSVLVLAMGGYIFVDLFSEDGNTNSKITSSKEKDDTVSKNDETLESENTEVLSGKINSGFLIKNSLDEIIIDSTHVEKISLSAKDGQYAINIEFNKEGKEIFAEFTENNIGKIAPICLNDTVIMSPTIYETIKDGIVLITMINEEQATDLFEQLSDV